MKATGVRIGLIGCGGQAVAHVGGLRRLPAAEIVLADRDPTLARAVAEQEKVAWVESPAEIFADPTIAAVGLCVPNPARACLIRQSVAAAKDFFCEPPWCETAPEARALLGLVEHSGRIGMVSHAWRYAPALQQARAILAEAAETGISPVIGKLTVATMRIGGRGALNEMVAQLLDLAVWYFGPLERAELMMTELLRPPRMIAGGRESADAEDLVLARFWTRTGIPLVIQADGLAPCFTQMIEVQGDNGALMASMQAGMPQFVFAVNGAEGFGPGRTDLSCDPLDLFAAQMVDFLAALHGRGPDRRDALADSVHVVEALEMLRG